MGQSDYAVIISQSYNIATNELGAPIVLALVRNEHDNEYLKQVFDTICDNIVRDRYYFENDNLRREYPGAYATFESADGNKQLAVYVTMPYGGWNL